MTYTNSMSDIKEFDGKVEDTKKWLLEEYAGLRTGRATPALLDSITVEQYGTKSPISHVATVSIDDPRTLRITPWDKATVAPIEAAISNANLGVSLSADDSGIRVSFPELTTERRAMLVKLVREKLEEARVRVKKEREHVWNALVKQEKDGEISEDEKFRAKDELQKHVDGANKSLEEMAAKKEEELND